MGLGENNIKKTPSKKQRDDVGMVAEDVHKTL